MPVEGPRDVEAILERLASARGDSELRRGLGDHLAYVAAVHPEWFRPYQELAISGLHDRSIPTFADRCALLAGAPDGCVETLLRRLHRHWTFDDAWSLAAIGTPAAMAAVADVVRAGLANREGSMRISGSDDFDDVGVWVPPAGPAVYRFSPQRLVVRVEPVTAAELVTADHPIGLPLDEVLADPHASPVTWHYLSIRLDAVPGVPSWPAPRAHLVSPRATWDWTLTSRIDARGRYRDEVVEFEEAEEFDAEEALAEQEAEGGPEAQARLLPYDDDLVYSNGLVEFSLEAEKARAEPADRFPVGTAGGPPRGVYPNPHCPTCGRLMFHVITVEHHIRDYGDGWRSLFLCEDCHVASVNATGWN